MADASPLDRIDAAIARIEAAAKARAGATGELARRHEAMRRRIADAIGAIDAMIEGES